MALDRQRYADTARAVLGTIVGAAMFAVLHFLVGLSDLPAIVITTVVGTFFVSLLVRRWVAQQAREAQSDCHGCPHCLSHAPGVDEDCWICADCDVADGSPA